MEHHNSKTDVDMELLRKSVNMILDHIINDLHIKSLKIEKENNLFWDIGIDDLFETASPPPHLGIGSVRDSCEFLTDMLQDATSTEDAPALMLTHVTAILNFVSHVVRA